MKGFIAATAVMKLVYHSVFLPPTTQENYDRKKKTEIFLSQNVELC